MIVQVYLLLSCAPCEGRVSGIVDVPNACCTLAIPTAIFIDKVDARAEHEDSEEALLFHFNTL